MSQHCKENLREQIKGFVHEEKYLSELHVLLSSGRSHDHHVPRGTRRRICGVFWTEQKKCGDHQLDSSTYEKVQEGKVSCSPLKPTMD